MAVYKRDIEKAWTKDNANASGVITAWHVVKWYDTGSVQTATPGDTPYGICAKQTLLSRDDLTRVKDSTLTAGDTRNDEVCTVIYKGECKAKLGATTDTVTAGAPIMLSITNNGCVTNWIPGYKKIGIALETSSTANAEVDVYVDFTGGVTENLDFQEITSAGAITIQHGLVEIKGSGALAVTLAAPKVAGNKLIIIAKSAHAHTVTQTTPGFDGGGTASDVGTYGGAILDCLEVVSRDNAGTLQWDIVRNVNVTVA